jgi:NADPH:quinone reductase-like Zn-dependent oxidoreductase
MGMQALVRDKYGLPDDVLRMERIEKPELTEDGVLVRVKASSVNRGDWYMLRGRPLLARPMMGGFLKPKERLVGTDFAGIVEAVGRGVTDFSPGDEVFGGRSGAFAEYVCVKNGIALKPAGITFEEAASVPVAAMTALQGVRDHGKVAMGQNVLVNGASGGVGVYAVQIAKAFGARVTAVCSTRNVELVRSLGADRVVDYTREDFTRSGERYDVVLDVAGSKSWRKLRRVLAPRARVIIIGGPGKTPVIGPLGHIGAMWLASRGSKRQCSFFTAKFSREDMGVLRDLLESGAIKPIVDRSYPLGDASEALRLMGEGHVQSKLVITV